MLTVVGCVMFTTYLPLCYKFNIMIHNLIDEEWEVEYQSETDLSYEPYIDGYVELYVDGFFEGVCQVWYDNEMDGREYIILNYNIIYLDVLTS
jgi:hypothetical protein